MRNISFQLTTEQIRNKTKTVTRRLGWKNLKPGTLLAACEKCMGLKKGEKIKKICTIKVVSVERQRLDDIIYRPSDCGKEGFWELTPCGFINMFCHEMKCKPETIVTRIEFEYV